MHTYLYPFWLKFVLLGWRVYSLHWTAVVVWSGVAMVRSLLGTAQDIAQLMREAVLASEYEASRATSIDEEMRDEQYIGPIVAPADDKVALKDMGVNFPWEDACLFLEEPHAQAHRKRKHLARLV